MTLEQRRLAAATLAVLLAVAAVVLLVASALPDLAGWILPAFLLPVTAVLVTVGRHRARRADTASARVLAAWAGATGSVGLSIAASLFGIGGGLVVLLLAVLAWNALLALWFRSSGHFAAVQWLGFVWAIIAHVYGITPLAGVVVAFAGLWWTGAVAFSRAVVVSTTLLVPLTVALALHPLTHSGPGIDGADVATVAGLTALALLLGARITDAQVYPALWPVMRSTAVVATVAQIAAGGVPVVASFLAPEHPWPGLFAGLGALAAAVAIALVTRVRPGTLRALEYCCLLWAVVAASVLIGPLAGSVVAALALGVPRIVDLLLGRVASTRILPSLLVVTLVSAGLVVVVPLGLVGTCCVLVGAAGLVAVVGMRVLTPEEPSRLTSGPTSPRVPSDTAEARS